MTAKIPTGKAVANDKHYVVAIGASAGGLEAIHEFFDNMPENRSLSFVIIQHLSPDYKSLLVDLVSRHTHMQVFEAENDLVIQRNCIYVIPNNKFITLRGYKLLLTEKPALTFPNNAIDVFLHSMARELKSQSIAVILSGTGSDGTKGIKSIKEYGGLVIVQEPNTSKFDGMPNSAITSGNIDYVLSPKEIPQQILTSLIGPTVDLNVEEELDDQILAQIFEEIRSKAGFDFHYYKTPTVTRRIFHRIRKGNFGSVREYLSFLTNNPEEARQLGKEFLINVTRFFRDHEAFDLLKREVIPAILGNKEPGEQLKVWVSACSTGEEAYSLAIVIDEVIEEMGLTQITCKFFATDIEKSNIEIASKGFYPNSVQMDISQERLDKYFVASEGGYTIIPRIRKQIVFSMHNIIKDPPFIKNDLVSCRNMLIYMNNILQQRIYSVLLFSLNLNGYMFLGPTENPNSIGAYISELNNKWKIFKKSGNAKIAPILSDITDKSVAGNGRNAEGNSRRKERHERDLWDDFKETLFSEFNFAAFQIDRNFEIVEAVGNFDQVLSLPKKILKLNLVRMLPSGVSTRLIAEIKEAWKTQERRVVKNLHLKSQDADVLLQALIQPDQKKTNSGLTLVAFHYMQLETSPLTEPMKLVTTDHNQHEYVLALEEELNETKGNLQYAVEDLETANEELQSSNEELLSANEELQSSNEELQSLNEELHTLNTEHQIKIRELIELNDDLTNYFRSSNIGQIFLDRNMTIRKFNPASVRIINFIDSDIGRPITDISTNVKYNGFVNDIQQVLESEEVVEKEVQLQSGVNLLLRIMPYITREKSASGVVISFFDITTITNLNNIIRGVFNSSLSAIFALQAIRDHRKMIVDFAVETSNSTAGKVLNRERDNLKGLQLVRDLRSPFMISLLEQFKSVVERDHPLHLDVFDEEARTWFEVTAVKMMDGLVVTYTDITQKKTSEDRLKRNYVELITAKETLKKLNTELENKIAERTQLLSESEERFRMVARATNDVIWDWDIVNNKVWMSDAFNLKFGYDTESEIDRSMWMEKVHPEERDEIRNSVLRVINSGNSQWIKEYRFRKSNGEYSNVLDRAYVMHDEQRTPYRMIGSMLDITELKRAEQEIASNVAQRQFLAESMPLIVWIATDEGTVTFVNKQFELYTGISSESALERGWKLAVHPDDAQRLDAQWNVARVSKREFQIEIRIRTHDAKFHWNIFRAKPQRDDSGNIINWVITTIDINDQKQLNELLERKVEARTRELRKINDALEVSNNDLQQFASVASHDLQEPLRKIHLYSNMLKERYGSVLGGGSSYLQKILLSSARMKSIINNVLNYSKLSAANATYQPTNLNELIEEILEDLEIPIQEKSAVIHLDKFPMIDTIPGQIRQVFQNLIGNALKFSKSGESPVIQITQEQTDTIDLDSACKTHGKFCRIQVKDNGIGFNEKFANNIFTLFQRLHSKDAYEGTGIGLAIAKKIIEKHNGLINAVSKEGDGATFTIVLPIHHEKAR